MEITSTDSTDLLAGAVALLRVAVCPNCDGSGGVPRQVAEEQWELEKCQWCDELHSLLELIYIRTLEVMRTETAEQRLALFRAERDWAKANIIHEKKCGHAAQASWNDGYLYAVEHIAEILGYPVRADAPAEAQRRLGPDVGQEVET